LRDSIVCLKTLNITHEFKVFTVQYVNRRRSSAHTSRRTARGATPFDGSLKPLAMVFAYPLFLYTLRNSLSFATGRQAGQAGSGSCGLCRNDFNYLVPQLALALAAYLGRSRRNAKVRHHPLLLMAGERGPLLREIVELVHTLRPSDGTLVVFLEGHQPARLTLPKQPVVGRPGPLLCHLFPADATAALK
jgi:hypothetical protein